MTIKQKMIAVLERLPEDATFDVASDKLSFCKGIEIALRQSEADDVMTQKEFMKEFLDEERQFDAARRVDA